MADREPVGVCPCGAEMYDGGACGWYCERGFKCPVDPFMTELMDAMMKPIRGSNCRSACTTKDHETWGECARAAAINVGNLK